MLSHLCVVEKIYLISEVSGGPSLLCVSTLLRCRSVKVQSIDHRSPLVPLGDLLFSRLRFHSWGFVFVVSLAFPCSPSFLVFPLLFYGGVLSHYAVAGTYAYICQ